MKKPLFLRRLKNRLNRNKNQDSRLFELETHVRHQREMLTDINEIVQSLQTENNLKKIKEEKELKEKTNPYKADKWKVVYDAKGMLSTVYLNGQELYGARCFSFDVDGTQEGLYKDVPILSYEGYGSIEVVTESE